MRFDRDHIDIDFGGKLPGLLHPEPELTKLPRDAREELRVKRFSLERFGLERRDGSTNELRERFSVGERLCGFGSELPLCVR